MELRHFARAVAAHKLVALFGVLAAIAFAFLAHVRVDPFGDPALAYRKANLWASTITLQLTQRDFPEGRVLERENRREALINLAPLYARLANTDPVKRKMRQRGPITGRISVRPVVDENRSSLPLVEMTSFAYSTTAARARVQRQAAAFISYIAEQQQANRVNPDNRVVLNIVSGPTRPVVVAPRKLTLPIVVFLSMIVVTGGLILALENLKRGRSSDRGDSDGPVSLEAVPTPPRVEQPSKVASSESLEVGKGVAGSAVRLPISARLRRNSGDGGDASQAPSLHDRDGEDSTAAALPDAAQQGRASRHVPRP